MLLTLRSIARFSASIAASPVVGGPVTDVAPASGRVDAAPEVDAAPVEGAPEGSALRNEFRAPRLVLERANAHAAQEANRPCAS
jgi:hypothetical protein